MKDETKMTKPELVKYVRSLKAMIHTLQREIQKLEALRAGGVI
jgi:hypothetical protein